jgi:hypothetical protein
VDKPERVESARSAGGMDSVAVAGRVRVPRVEPFCAGQHFVCCARRVNAAVLVVHVRRLGRVRRPAHLPCTTGVTNRFAQASGGMVACFLTLERFGRNIAQMQ